MISDNLDTVKAVQFRILDIFKAFIAFCDENSFRYYMAWGSALGTVRHAGFIPWDDDLDVYMPREDYDKLLQCWGKATPEYMKLVSKDNVDTYPFDFAKIFDSRKSVVQDVEESVGRKLPQGIYIDIFPLDYGPNTKLGCFFFWSYYKLLNSFIVYKKGWAGCRTFASHISYTLGCILSGLLSRKYKKLRPIDIESKGHCYLNKKKSDYYVDFSFVSTFRGFLKRRFNCDMWGKGKIGKFEGIKVFLPEKPEEYLKTIYGDYMTLPNEADRVPKHANEEYVPWRMGGV